MRLPKILWQFFIRRKAANFGRSGNCEYDDDNKGDENNGYEEEYDDDEDVDKIAIMQSLKMIIDRPL